MKLLRKIFTWIVMLVAVAVAIFVSVKGVVGGTAAAIFLGLIVLFQALYIFVTEMTSEDGKGEGQKVEDKKEE